MCWKFQVKTFRFIYVFKVFRNAITLRNKIDIIMLSVRIIDLVFVWLQFCKLRIFEINVHKKMFKLPFKTHSKRENTTTLFPSQGFRKKTLKYVVSITRQGNFHKFQQNSMLTHLEIYWHSFADILWILIYL